MLGIGIITYKRLAAVASCTAFIQAYTKTPYKLVVADDGSEDGTTSYCSKVGIHCVGLVNQGVAYNVNRALYSLKDCDPIILLDSDIWPTEYGWEEKWIQAASIWGHVNLAFNNTISGNGTPEDPYLCEHFGSGCVATTKSAFENVGYQDPRFYGQPYSIAHAEWTFRYERFFQWKKATSNSTPPCLKHAVKLVDFGTFYNPDAVNLSCETMKKINSDEPLYRDPWRDDLEKEDFIKSL